MANSTPLREFSPEIIRAATAEARALFLKFTKEEELGKYSYIPIILKRLPKAYRPIATTGRTVVIPSCTQSEIPLAFKGSVEIYGGLTHMSFNGRRLITGYGNGKDPFRRDRIENNFQALASLNLGVTLPPQKIITPLPECADSYNLLLVPDLTRRGKVKLLDLFDINLADPKNRDLAEKLKKVKTEFNSRKWHVCRHPGRTPEELLDKTVKHMLFVLEQDGKRELVVGDIDHFSFE